MRSRLRLALTVSAIAIVGVSAFELSGAQRATAAPPTAAAVLVDNGGTVLSHRSSADTGALGVTFGFEGETMGGQYVNGANATYNLPMYQPSGESSDKFWLNYVEELVTAGVDYVAVDTRGYVPGTSIPTGGGDPRELPELVTAIREAGDVGKLKIAALDDTPSSMTGAKNWILHHTVSYSPPFDFAVTTGSGEGGYKYLWDYDLEPFFKAVPGDMLYKINGRPLIYTWSDDNFAFTNQGHGNSARYLTYVRNQAKAKFHEDPFFAVNDSWVRNDPAVASVMGATDGWFDLTNTYTNRAYGAVTVGTTLPSFHVVQYTTNMVIDPKHGNTLIDNLRSTVGNGDSVTLVEGFTDWLENAALWRTEPGSYAARQRDYPNQDINILRRYSKNPFPSTLTVQAETADSVTGFGGNPWKIYRGDLGVQTTTDVGSGWNVGYIKAGETETWQQLPMQNTEHLKIRVASPSSFAKLRFVVDGVPGPIVSVPNTGGWQKWQTIDAGSFKFKPGSYHTVQLQYLTYGLNVNWWQAVNAAS